MNQNQTMNIGKFKNLLLLPAILIVSLSSFIYLVKERNYISNNIKKVITGKRYVNPKFALEKKLDEKHNIWSKKLLSGGYILFFRHAERDKWIDVQMYDALESQEQANNSNGFRFAENEYFEGAVCLNERGKIQAKAMGEVVNYSKLPIGYVVSSTSCRARQTADLVFGGYDSLEKKLVHKGPYLELGDRSIFLEEFILNLPYSKDKNTIISAHNGVIGAHLFPKAGYLEEGGFFVLSKNNNKLVIEHKFHNFNDFSKQFFIRNHNQ